MRRFILATLLSLVCALTALVPEASACQCSGEFYEGKSFREAAELRALRSSVIFEGMLAKVELKWAPLEAKDGQMVEVALGTRPGLWEAQYISLTFRVERSYKGTNGPEVRIRTGLGGGDCGASFASGLTYLIYASQSSNGDPAVSMCSPGGWVEAEQLQPELRYLRKEPPTRMDLAPWGPWYGQSKRDGKQHQRGEDKPNQYIKATGKICGKVLWSQQVAGTVYFLSTLGYSPMVGSEVILNYDGSFCSRQLGPGKYYVYFQAPFDDSHFSAVYYPGVNTQPQATPVEVTAGHTTSDIVLNASVQQTYSVRGLLTTDKKEKPGPGGISVVLVPLDGGPYARYRFQPMSFQGPLSIINAESFQLEKVSPGHYAAFATSYETGSMSKRVDVTVTNHSKFVLLKLSHKER